MAIATVLAAVAPLPTHGTQPPETVLPPGAERAYRELADRVDGAAAMDLVRCSPST